MGENAEMNAPVCRIDSFEDLVELALSEHAGNLGRLELAPDVATLVIHVEGKGYGNFIPGDQLRTLWEIQEDFYRIASFALHGTTDIRSLTVDERHLFELKVKTKEGSWVGEVFTSDYWNALSFGLVNKMSGLQIALTLCICVAIVCGYFVYKSRNSRIIEAEKERTQQKWAEALARVVDSFNNKELGDAGCEIVEKTGNSIDRTARSVAKRSRGADQISVGGVKYDTAMIEQIKSRSKGEREDPDVFSGTFRILSLDRSAEVWQMKISNLENDDVIPVRIASEMVADDSLSGAEVKQLINRAFYEDHLVDLEVVCAKNKNFLTGIELHHRDESIG